MIVGWNPVNGTYVSKFVDIEEVSEIKIHSI